MPYIDQIITDALAGSPETHVAILAREVVRLREALAVDLRDDSSGMNGGDPVRTLMNEVQRLKAEIVRLKIAHLWRVVEVIHFKYRAGLCKRHQTNRIDKLQSACLAKITELKESQCSTKS